MPSILPPVEPALITHGDRSLAYIALTFDACQAAGRPTGYDEAIIRILNATHTPATLFLSGLWMSSHPTQTRALAANPLFELGSHSWSHPDFAGLSPQAMDAELQRTQAIMVKLTSHQPTLFRFPYDQHTPEALEVVGQHGLRAIGGDVISGDADAHVSAKDLVAAITAQAHNGSIIIMHVNGRGWHTAEALPALIRRLREQGYTFVNVSQLLGLAPLPASVSHAGNKNE
jgi:peptidoglycan/xylan/chitin deacetylase (PgdA/CDA1 family)